MIAIDRVDNSTHQIFGKLNFGQFEDIRQMLGLNLVISTLLARTELLEAMLKSFQLAQADCALLRHAQAKSERDSHSVFGFLR